ncbi:MAG: FxsA family protein [Peptococcaceae bacterium]
MGKLFLAFTLIPLVEVALLVKLGQYFGALPTILLVIFTGGVGVFLAKSQGLFVLSKIQYELQQGMVPGNALIDALLVLIGSVFLITPGLLTDCAGFLLLFPFSRTIVRNYLKYKFKNMIDNGKVNVYFGKF